MFVVGLTLSHCNRVIVCVFGENILSCPTVDMAHCISAQYRQELALVLRHEVLDLMKS